MAQSMENHNYSSVWRAEILRLSVFFRPPIEPDPNLWQSVVGEPPEATNIQAKLKLRQDEGQYKDGRLILTAVPARTDWVFISAFDTDAREPLFDRLQTYSSALETFTELANRWFAVCPSPIRIAFGAVLDIPEPSRQAGYAELKSFLHAVQIDADHSSDLLYQINRRRESNQIPGLLINRLSKWSVALSKINQVELGPASVQYVILGDERYFARLELDINTAQEHNEPFSREQLLPLFSELTGLATEVADKGDIK